MECEGCDGWRLVLEEMMIERWVNCGYWKDENGGWMKEKVFMILCCE